MQMRLLLASDWSRTRSDQLPLEVHMVAFFGFCAFFLVWWIFVDPTGVMSEVRMYKIVHRSGFIRGPERIIGFEGVFSVLIFQTGVWVFPCGCLALLNHVICSLHVVIVILAHYTY